MKPARARSAQTPVRSELPVSVVLEYAPATDERALARVAELLARILDKPPSR